MKKSKVSISSPEELEKKLQYTSPLTWISLAVVIFLIIGAFVWSCLYKIKDTIFGKANIANGEVSLVIDSRVKPKLHVGQKIYINELEGEILSFVDDKPVISHFELTDGDYTYSLIIEIKPIEYLIK